MKAKYIILCLLFLLTACDNVGFVKEGNFEFCPKKSVGEMFDNFLGSPQWVSITGEDGFSYVNVRGSVKFGEADATLKVQFIVNRENGSFEINAVEINGNPASGSQVDDMLKKMCNG